MTTRHALPPELLAAAESGAEARELARVWSLAENASPLKALDPPDAARIQAIRHRLARRHSSLTLVSRRRYAAIAACLLLLVSIGFFTARRPVHITAASALDTQLPDGSSVALFSGSALTYHRRFGRSHRELTLSGSALFDVRTSSLPFVVEAPRMTVTVLGTKFSVDAQEEEGVVYVTEGVVEVRANGNVRQLAAGEGLRLEAKTGSFTALAPEDAPRPDLFIQIKQPLGVMFDEVENLFDVEIMAEDHIRQHVHNFKHEITTVESLVNDLCRSVTAMKLRYRATATGFEVLQE